MIDLLKGIRVLDFTHVHAGPLCTYQLGLMGAEIIKIESPDGGDQMRQMGAATYPGMSPGFVGQGAGKRSLALDLKADAAAGILERLVTGADVVVHNLRPGAPERLGLGYEAVRSMRPDIVYCAISGYGQTGPASERPAFDHLIQGESGMFMTTGLPEQPVRVGFAVADSGTAVIASSAINAALVRRGRTGEGAFIDVSMLESCMTLMGLSWYNYLGTGRIPPRVGPNPLAAQGSAGTFRTADDRLLMVNANNHRLFERLATALDREDLLQDARFATPAAAQEHRVALRELFAGIFATDTAAHWDQLLADAGVPAGLARTFDEVVESPQLAERAALTRMDEVPGMPGETITLLGAGFQVDGTPTAAENPPQAVGEHTIPVLAELGFTTSEIDTLLADRVVATI